MAEHYPDIRNHWAFQEMGRRAKALFLEAVLKDVRDAKAEKRKNRRPMRSPDELFREYRRYLTVHNKAAQKWAVPFGLLLLISWHANDRRYWWMNSMNLQNHAHLAKQISQLIYRSLCRDYSEAFAFYKSHDPAFSQLPDPAAFLDIGMRMVSEWADNNIIPHTNTTGKGIAAGTPVYIKDGKLVALPELFEGVK